MGSLPEKRHEDRIGDARMFIELTYAEQDPKQPGWPNSKTFWVNPAAIQSFERKTDYPGWRPHTEIWWRGATYQDRSRVAQSPDDIVAKSRQAERAWIR